MAGQRQQTVQRSPDCAGDNCASIVSAASALGWDVPDALVRQEPRRDPAPGMNRLTAALQ